MIRSIYQYANFVPRSLVTWSASATFLKTTDHYCGIKRSVQPNRVNTPRRSFAPVMSFRPA